MKILINDILHKTLLVSKPLRIRFDKIDNFIRVYYVTRYLALFNLENCEAILDSIECLINQKKFIAFVS